MCVPAFIVDNKNIKPEDLANHMKWCTREKMDEDMVIPYGVSVDTSCLEIDGVDMWPKLKCAT